MTKYYIKIAAMALVCMMIFSFTAFAQPPEMYLQLGYKTGDDFNSGQELVFSPDGSLFAAVSGGNTIRIWEADSGREVQTLVAQGRAIKSIAFLPDNRRIISGDNDNMVRFWDISSGKQLVLLKGHQDGVRGLAVSPDGSLLASAERKAIKLWDINRESLITTIPAPTDEYGASPLVSTAFSPDNSKLIFTNMRGTVIVFGVREQRIISQIGYDQTGGFSSLNVLGFIPEGKVILGGFATLIVFDMNRAEVTKKKFKDIMMAVEYMSQDGSIIATRKSGESRIRVFDASLQERLSIPLDENVTNTCYLSGRNLVAVSALKDKLKFYDLTTGNQLQNFGAKAFTPRGGSFSKDGNYITVNVQVPVPGQFTSDVWTKVWNLKNATMERQFTYKNHKGGVQFDSYSAGRNSEYDELNNCFYSVDSEPAVGAIGSPYVTIYRIPVKDKYDFKATFYNNRAQWKILKRFKAHNQNVSAMTVNYMHGYIATGSLDKTINLFSYPGTALIRSFQGHTAEITELTFSPDGTRLLSQSADQTTRLWDVATGKELARFINFTDGEWIAITPEGYYNASPNGDRYLNVRAGSNVYGIDNYREAFFRPDLVKLAISGGSLTGYRTLADIKLPPRVSIVRTQTASAAEEFKLTLRLEERGGGVGDVRLLLNGSAVVLDSSRALRIVQKDSEKVSYRNYSLRLASGANSISVVVFNADNTMQSNEVSHQVTASFTSTGKPAMHALIIGVQEFKNPKLKLRYSVADARLMASTFKKAGNGLFGQVNIKLLTTVQETTRDAVIKALEGYRSLRPDDLFVFFVASHGTVDEGEYFLLTSNVGSTSTDKLKRDALSQRNLKELIANIPATKKLILIDTCNAAALGDAIQVAMLTRGMSEDTAMKVLARAVGSTIISASTSVQEALEGYQGHGLLTWAIAQGLQGKADADKDGFIKTTELANYVDDEVPRIAERQFKRAQYPTVSPSGQAFPVGKVK